MFGGVYQSARLNQLDFSSQGPRLLFNATVAGASPANTLFPGTLDAIVLPDGPAKSKQLTASGVVCGGVFATNPEWEDVLLDFAVQGASGQSLVVEIGQVLAKPPDQFGPQATSGQAQKVGIALKMDAATLTSSTLATIANVNPFTGETLTGTWRLCDAISHANLTQLGQVVTSTNGAAGNASEIQLDVTEALYYYVLVTNLNALTGALCVIRPK